MLLEQRGNEQQIPTSIPLQSSRSMAPGGEAGPGGGIQIGMNDKIDPGLKFR